ncbi:hypothetical protein GCM10009784_24370 [Arthrobacter parietis]|uniref:TIGR01906 family membrane protein n=1 Tax=Arthrobacter parietis TaxID=271434 RepID=A0ABN3AZW1_9MICC
MADKAENENQSGTAGSERRAALRSDQPGGGSTRVRESGFPMRKASTLPDVSAYTRASQSGTENKNGTEAEAKVEAETEDKNETDTSVTPAPVGTHVSTTPPGSGDSHGVAEPEITSTGQENPITIGSGYGGGVYSPPDHPTADPSSPATQQIAAIPVGRTSGGSTGAATAEDATRDDATRDATRDDTTRDATRDDTTRDATNDDAAPDTSSLAIRPPEEEVNRRANQRDEAAAAKPLLPRILQVAVALFFPIILLAAAVRAVTTPLFLWVEYHRPGFPADSYGFSTEDRMTYGSYAMDYILNWAPARYLGDLVNTDGDQLFLDSEVGHMADVKGVLSTGFVVATVLAILTIIACIYLARRYPGGIRRGLFAGAVATLVLAIALAVAGILAWETFFTQVHALLFADGTWTFRLDDTLIRLFPAQFWIDAAATVGAIVLIGAVLTLVLTWPTKARREKSADAYAARRANNGI